MRAGTCGSNRTCPHTAMLCYVTAGTCDSKCIYVSSYCYVVAGTCNREGVTLQQGRAVRIAREGPAVYVSAYCCAMLWR